jgi:hypothetical protein
MESPQWALTLELAPHLPESLEQLTRSIAQNRNLTEIHFPMCGLQDEGAKAVAQGLKNSKKIQTVNLEANLIQKEGILALLQSLKNSPSLQHLWLSRTFTFLR